MSSLPGRFENVDPSTAGPPLTQEPLTPEIVDERPDAIDETRLQPRTLVPLLLFLATCYTTYATGGFAYAAPLMLILLCHEFGHYIQARRYHVAASLPYFIPMPGTPLGTMGAVIAMSGHMGNRKSLFDIGISGPLAGLVPALVCSVIGIQWSTVVNVPPGGFEHGLGAPLLFQILVPWLHGPLAENQTIELHALARAGWVGILITSLNLFPIGQLDGGHILYALLRKKAHLIASMLLGVAIVAVLVTRNYQWSFMLLLLVLMGPNHPPTANDDLPLGTGRVILGWLTLMFVIIGFTPTPFM